MVVLVLEPLEGLVVPPWFENLGKRQVRSPKVYLRDTGLLHTLLGLVTRHQLLGHREGRPRPPAGRGDRLRW